MRHLYGLLMSKIIKSFYISGTMVGKNYWDQHQILKNMNKDLLSRKKQSENVNLKIFEYRKCNANWLVDSNKAFFFW